MTLLASLALRLGLGLDRDLLAPQVRFGSEGIGLPLRFLDEARTSLRLGRLLGCDPGPTGPVQNHEHDGSQGKPQENP